MVQHIADVDTVPHPGVLNEHMGDSPYQFPVLENRAPAHSLHDSAGHVKEFRIRHLDHQGLIRLPGIPVDFCNTNLVLFHFTAHSTTDHGVTGMNLFLGSDRNRLLIRKEGVDPVYRAINALICILGDGT